MMGGGSVTGAEPERILGLVQKYSAPPPLRLRAWREYRALTQQELADRAGVARRTVTALETGAQRPHPATVRALAAALSTTPEYLRSDPPADPPPSA